MKLYYSKGACSLVPRIIINEIGLPCEYIAVDLKTKKTEAGEDFLKINPKGAVPTLMTNKAAVLTENAVILQYLADTNHATQLLPPINDFMRYRVLEWLNYITTELHKGFGPLFNPNVTQEMKDKIVLPILRSKFNYVNKHLENYTYLLGDNFTLPDAYLFVMLTWAKKFKFDFNEWPNISRYLLELQKRKSIQQSLKEEGLLAKEGIA
jgi:glutathione S-transferase